jgi:two-component system, chemotaxis family, chemotaxis protein CheY
MASPSICRGRALVVDDSGTTRHIVASILAHLGYEVSEAADGVEALERLREMAAPDVALIDWNMPRLDGLELVREVRAEPAYDRMRVLMITTENDLGRVSAALDAGADEYLMKPFTAEMLLEKLAIVGIASVE